MDNERLLARVRSTTSAVVSRAMAEALVTGIDEAAQNNRPLTQVQQTDLATMALMSFDGVVSEVVESIKTDLTLDELAADFGG